MSADPKVSLNPPMDNSEPMPNIPAQPTGLRTFKGPSQQTSDNVALDPNLSDDETQE